MMIQYDVVVNFHVTFCLNMSCNNSTDYAVNYVGVWFPNIVPCAPLPLSTCPSKGLCIAETVVCMSSRSEGPIQGLYPVARPIHQDSKAIRNNKVAVRSNVL